MLVSLGLVVLIFGSKLDLTVCLANGLVLSSKSPVARVSSPGQLILTSGRLW